VFAVFTAVGSLLLIFSGNPMVLRLFLSPPEARRGSIQI